VTVLAVAGYGAVFTALALVARNPMLPAAAILGWEWINFLLPPALKNLSVIHPCSRSARCRCRRACSRCRASRRPAPLAIGGLLALVALLLVLAARRARRLEVSYGGD